MNEKLKQSKALEKAIKKSMDEVIHSLLVSGTEINKPLPSQRKVFKGNAFYYYYFRGTQLHIFINYIPSLPNGLYFEFPDAYKIKEKAKEIYKDFDSSTIDDVVYNFEHKNLEDCFKIDVENSKLKFYDCRFGEKIDIDSASEVEFRICNLRYAKNIIIYSNNINLINCRIGDSKILKDSRVFLRGVETNLNEVIMDVCNDIEIHTSLLTIKNSNLTSQKIFLNSDMIESVNSNIMANNKITIYDDYNDDIKGIKAPCVIYNGVDISNSEGLHIHKEKDKLLDVLKKAKTIIEEFIEKDKKK